MVKKDKREVCCVSVNKDTCCCRVESIVTVDERGQMVLPKEIREKAKIRAGDKLAVIGWETDGEICCITLMKADDLAGAVTDKLGPVMTVVMKKKEEK